jgi:hypothetical protein
VESGTKQRLTLWVSEVRVRVSTTTILKLDDLIGDKARDSKAEMQTAKDWIDNIQAFFTDFLRGKMDIIGTRWAFDDLYSHVFSTYGIACFDILDQLQKNRDEASKLMVKPIFPEAFTLESFEILRRIKRFGHRSTRMIQREGSNEFHKIGRDIYNGLAIISFQSDKMIMSEL